MNVNGVTSTQTAYTGYTDAASQKVSAQSASAQSTKSTAESGVVYEPSKETKVTKKYAPDTALINKLKADAEARTSQLRSIVEQLMCKQANAYGQANDIWSFLAKGDFEVDPATKAQAQADIAEDGYWGVDQTSDRIISFANALTGGDPDKVEEMRDAFIQGFQQAKKAWGDELPEISQKTYEAVMKKFDEIAGVTTAE